MSHRDITRGVWLAGSCPSSPPTGDLVEYLVKATPTGGLLDLPTEERDELMTRERQVATALIGAGTITWMWRLPDGGTTLAIWNVENDETLDELLRTLPVAPYNVIEKTPLVGHPAFPPPLRAAAG